MPRGLIPILAVVAFLMLAGCANRGPGEEANNGNGGVTSTGPTPSTGTTPTGQPPSNGGLHNVTFEECHGAFPTFDIPTEQARPHIPDPFEPRGFFPATTHVNIDVMRCERVILAATVEEDVAMLVSYVSVTADNASWNVEGSLGMFAYDLLVTNQEVMEALTNLGATPQLASLTTQVTPLVQDYEQFIWTFESERVSYDVTFQFPGNAEGDDTGYDVNYWFGTNPYARVDVKQDYSTHGLQQNDAGLVVIEGTSPFEDMMGSPVLFSRTETWHGLSWELPDVPVRFNAP